MAFGDKEQGFGRARGIAAALFPVLEGPHGNAEQIREGALRQPGRKAGAGDLGHFGTMDAGASAGIHLAHRGEQFVAMSVFGWRPAGLRISLLIFDLLSDLA